MSRDIDKLFDLKKKRQMKVKEMREIVDNAEHEERSLTAEDKEKYDHLKQEAQELREKIKREEELHSLESELEDTGGFEGRGRTDPDGEEESREVSGFDSLGEFVQTVRFNPRDKRLSETREMQMKSGADGGFTVPDEFLTDIMQVEPQDAIFRPRSTVIPAGDSPDASISMPALDQTPESNMYGGVEVSWLEEGGDKQETDAELYEIKLDPNEVAAYITVSDKLLRNAPALNALIERLLRGAILAAEDHKFYAGTGVGTPLGVLEAPATKFINRAGANEIVYQDIVSMYSSMKMGGSAIITTTQTALPQLMQLEDTQGNLIWQPNAREGAPGSLLGIPVILNERSKTLGNKGDIMMMDLSYYMIKDGFGIAVDASEHVHFRKNKTVIKAFWNVDGQPWLKDKILLEDGETEVSPFVGLDVPQG
ncbi:phage major capsid protein [Natroniella acetigena]|uniref:phage major capsid protein n=1 Tax=Natroniella acetigena TaxID=52004 RepID=UPI00200A1E33|nr:phage major capsid protein [Natroniella acetigena]MCK8826400.1 phage major capsid protein [Natroniella acetigena]